MALLKGNGTWTNEMQNNHLDNTFVPLLLMIRDECYPAILNKNDILLYARHRHN